MGAPNAPWQTRFWRFVTPVQHGCWNWKGTTAAGGYGSLGVRGRRGKRAHRLSWILHYGPIPEGQCVLHRCDNPSCVRPDHLFLGTQIDNIRDMNAKGRRRGPITLRGERNNFAVLTEAQVVEIRRRYWEARGTRMRAPANFIRQLVKEYGVTRYALWLVIKRINWKHVA